MEIWNYAQIYFILKFEERISFWNLKKEKKSKDMYTFWKKKTSKI